MKLAGTSTTTEAVAESTVESGSATSSTGATQMHGMPRDSAARASQGSQGSTHSMTGKVDMSAKKWVRAAKKTFMDQADVVEKAEKAGHPHPEDAGWQSMRDIRRAFSDNYRDKS